MRDLADGLVMPGVCAAGVDCRARAYPCRGPRSYAFWSSARVTGRPGEGQGRSANPSPTSIRALVVGSRRDQFEPVGGPTGMTVSEPLPPAATVEADSVVYDITVDGVGHTDFVVAAGLIDVCDDLEGFRTSGSRPPVDL